MSRKNQCHYCRWFDKWENLEPHHIPAGYGLPALDVFIHRGVTGKIDYWSGVYEECEKYHVPNPKRRARPRCPKCGHGNPKGHKRGECLAWVVTRYYEGDSDPYTCGCKYRGGEVA